MYEFKSKHRFAVLNRPDNRMLRPTVDDAGSLYLTDQKPRGGRAYASLPAVFGAGNRI